MFRTPLSHWSLIAIPCCRVRYYRSATYQPTRDRVSRDALSLVISQTPMLPRKVLPLGNSCAIEGSCFYRRSLTGHQPYIQYRSGDTTSYVFQDQGDNPFRGLLSQRSPVGFLRQAVRYHRSASYGALGNLVSVNFLSTISGRVLLNKLSDTTI